MIVPYERNNEVLKDNSVVYYSTFVTVFLTGKMRCYSG